MPEHDHSGHRKAVEDPRREHVGGEQLLEAADQSEHRREQALDDRGNHRGVEARADAGERAEEEPVLRHREAHSRGSEHDSVDRPQYRDGDQQRDEERSPLAEGLVDSIGGDAGGAADLVRTQDRVVGHVDQQVDADRKRGPDQQAPGNRP